MALSRAVAAANSAGAVASGPPTAFAAGPAGAGTGTSAGDPGVDVDSGEQLSWSSV